MPPVIATASGGLALGLLSLVGGVWGVAFGIARPLVRRIDCIRFDARLCITLCRLGLGDLRPGDLGGRLVRSIDDSLDGRLRSCLVGGCLVGHSLDLLTFGENILG